MRYFGKQLRLNRLLFISLLLFCLCHAGWSQSSEEESVDIKVYGIEEGLTHRNVFKILQDPMGFIWIATVNGLNKFDGHSFLHYSSNTPQFPLTYDYISDMTISPDSNIWLVNPNYLTVLSPKTNRTQVVRASKGSRLYEQPRTFSNLNFGPNDELIVAAYLNETGESQIERLMLGDSILQDFKTCEGTYTRRATHWDGETLLISYAENTIHAYQADGTLSKVYELPNQVKGVPSLAWVNTIQSTKDGTIWALLNNGQVYYLPRGNDAFIRHPITDFIFNQGVANALLVEDNGNIWVGGLANLWQYHAEDNRIHNYNSQIRDLLKNTCNYRQIFKDDSGVIWVASDFGAIKLVDTEQVFSHYMSEGSEYCSEGYCSMRGIAEDERGNIYFSYYNSIHVLEKTTNLIRPLFPQNDYFNFPFGLLYHRGHLYTGNGRRINLENLQVDTLFDHPNLDLGHCTIDRDDGIWFGFRQWLYHLPAGANQVQEIAVTGIDTAGLNYSFLYPGRSEDVVWVGTLEKGLYKIDRSGQLLAQYTKDEGSLPKLRHNKINGIYEDGAGNLWLATGEGLHRWRLHNNQITVFDQQHGLVNNFINGLLSEGDSCFWVSTDVGLGRLDTLTRSFTAFSKQDGLSANEFNRVSCYRAQDGRMFFGGLNGINAFYPSSEIIDQRQRINNKVLFTGFSKLDGRYDSIISKKTGLSPKKAIELAHYDKFFSFEFALANYQNPASHLYSYKLEGHEEQWSPPSPLHEAKYNGVPPGDYTFRVRAATDQGHWNQEELAIEVHMTEAFYKSWWFIGLCFLTILGAVFGILEYQLYRSRQRQKELRREVKARTLELERAMRKSDELLLNILPAETAEELKKFGKARAKRYEQVTVLFTDFKDFTSIAQQLEPEELVAEVDYCFRNFDTIIEQYGIEKIKTIGDAYMCAGGLPKPDAKNPHRVVEAAVAIRDFMDRYRAERQREGRLFFETRLGIHTGPIVAGIVGTKKFVYDIWGDTVNIAARLEGQSEVGRINISATTYNLVKDHFHCTYRGKVAAKNKGEIEMYFVETEKSNGQA